MAGVTLRERRQELTRADLVEATLGLVSVSDLREITIERIAEAGGVSRATIYAHFPGGRDDLLRAAYARTGELLLRQAETAAQASRTWDARILGYARTMIEFSRSPHLGHFYSVSGPHLLGFRAERGVGSAGYLEVLRDELAGAIDRGELVPAADAEALAILLVSSLRDAGIEASRRPERADALVAAVKLLLDGLRLRKEGGDDAD